MKNCLILSNYFLPSLKLPSANQPFLTICEFFNTQPKSILIFINKLPFFVHVLVNLMKAFMQVG